MSEKGTPQKKVERDSLQRTTENHRFSLAMLFIGGFLAIMVIALIGEFFDVYESLKDLAAIFSGWITAVIGFYFLQQNTEKAQQQAREVTKEASEASRKTARLTAVSESNVLGLSESIKKRKETTEKHSETIGKQKELIGRQKKLISELISKLEEMSSGGE